MKSLACCALLYCFAILQAAAETGIQSADDWYRNVYAPLYRENPGQNAADIASHFDETVHYHERDGAVKIEAGEAWITGAIDGWLAEGWLGSEIAEYQSELVNPTTAVFKVKWRDRYQDGSVLFECGWYMADHKDGAWVITQYADLDCAGEDQ